MNGGTHNADEDDAPSLSKAEPAGPSARQDDDALVAR